MYDYSILDIKSVYTPPYTLDFIEFVNCPICDQEIEVFNMILDEKSFVSCVDCEHDIRFCLVKI